MKRVIFGEDFLMLGTIGIGESSLIEWIGKGTIQKEELAQFFGTERPETIP